MDHDAWGITLYYIITYNHNTEHGHWPTINSPWRIPLVLWITNLQITLFI